MAWLPFQKYVLFHDLHFQPINTIFLIFFIDNFKTNFDNFLILLQVFRTEQFDIDKLNNPSDEAQIDERARNYRRPSVQVSFL